jgi:hypothetical protein
MKKLNLLIGTLCCALLFSCTTNDAVNETISSEKKITQVEVQDHDGKNKFVETFLYDDNNNLIEDSFNNVNGLTKILYTYNSSNQLIKDETSRHVNQILYSKKNHTLSYNNDSKVSNIEYITTTYNSDGSISNQTSENNSITYSNNSIIKTSDNSSNTKVIYGLNNNLITTLKIYKNNLLKEDMRFDYDAEGNCISGTNTITEGSFSSPTVTNLNFNVTYSIEKKHQIYNASLINYAILTSTNFTNLRHKLVKIKGNKYPTIIEIDNGYKETYTNSFDNDGYPISIAINSFPDTANSIILTYTWE